MHNIRPVRNEEDYEWALGEIASYFENQPEPGTPDGDRFDVLAELIEAYEERHWPIEAPDPVEAIRFAMEMKGLKQSDLADLFGSRSRASEILNKHRPLTLSMIQALNEQWKIPAEVLIRPYHLANDDRASAPRRTG